MTRAVRALAAVLVAGCAARQPTEPTAPLTPAVRRLALELDSTFADPTPPRVHMLSATLLCAVPVAVALLGGVAAFIHTMG